MIKKIPHLRRRLEKAEGCGNAGGEQKNFFPFSFGSKIRDG
jgi:hypothetical protein